MDRGADIFADQLEKGREALRKQEYELAIKELKQAVSLMKDSPDANYLLGLAYYHAGKTQDAVRSLKRAVRLQPHFPEAHYLLAVLLYRDSRKETDAELRLALEQDPRLSQALLLFGNLAVIDHKTSVALDFYERALQGSLSVSERSSLLRLVEGLRNSLEIDRHPLNPAFRNPEIVYRAPLPVYAPTAVAERIYGMVRLVVLIDIEGRVSDVRVLVRIHPDLDQSAADWIRKCKFSPALKNSNPVLISALIEVDFKFRR
jgi:TonB family protein